MCDPGVTGPTHPQGLASAGGPAKPVCGVYTKTALRSQKTRVIYTSGLSCRAVSHVLGALGHAGSARAPARVDSGTLVSALASRLSALARAPTSPCCVSRRHCDVHRDPPRDRSSSFSVSRLCLLPSSTCPSVQPVLTVLPRLTCSCPASISPISHTRHRTRPNVRCGGCTGGGCWEPVKRQMPLGRSHQ